MNIFKRFETVSELVQGSRLYPIQSIHGYYFICHQFVDQRFRFNDENYTTKEEAQEEIARALHEGIEDDEVFENYVEFDENDLPF